MIALLLFLLHAATILSVWEEWPLRGVTDTSFRVLGLLLLACVLGVWVLEAESWRFDILAVSTVLISGVAGAVYSYWFYVKTADLVRNFLHQRDPLKQWLSARHPARKLFQKRRTPHGL